MSILVSGSIAFDHIMTFPDRFKNHIMPDKIHIINLSFLINSLNKNLGGTGGNIAYNVSLLEEKPLLFGTVGSDFGPYQAHCQKHQVDAKYVKEIPDLFTAQFFVTTDLDDNQIAAFYPGAMARSAAISVAEVYKKEKIEIAVIAPDDPAGMIKHCQECRKLDIPFILNIGQQVIALEKAELLACLDHSLALVGNDYEIEMFSRKTSLKPLQLLDHTNAVVTTKGYLGSQILTSEALYEIPPVKPKKIVDPTGAGDAFTAGLVKGLLKKLSWETSGRIGSLAATEALQSQGTQNHFYSLTEFRKKYKKEYSVPCPV